ncbi:MAG: TonB-dependent receptor [Marinifilaceae bacterium]|jgi:TonB-linked SusC/RagA family outer membrane protein|nr:TonB-dependent receptor [Marinifilaceae bacterium]
MKKMINSYFFLKEWKYRKIYLIMRNILFLIFVIQFSAIASVSSQKIKNVEYKNASLLEVFKDLKLKSGYGILFKKEDIEKSIKINYIKNNATVSEVLFDVLKDTGLEYKLEENVIVVFKEIIKTVQQKTYTIKGKVTDSKGAPLPGVTVQLDGTTIGTPTNINGQFKINVKNKNGILIISFIGKKTARVNYEHGKDISVKLKDDNSDLDEVKVVAYGTTTRREMTGAVTSVSSKDLKDVPASNISNLLQGRIAGMDVQNISGAPGSNQSSTIIRGFNTLEKAKSNPLWVIDGVPVIESINNTTGTSPIADIDPSMIESIEVLKDAAAASLYGSRAANGVIMVTTKRGRKGKTSFSSKISYSYGFVPEFPTVYAGKDVRNYRNAAIRNARLAVRDYATGSEIYPNSYAEAWELQNSGKWGSVYDGNWGDGSPYGAPDVQRMYQDSINPFYNNSTNWFDEMFRAGKVVDANIRATGGTEKMLYSIGASYYSENGIVKHSKFDRASVISRTDFKISKKLNLTNNTFISFTSRKRSGANGLSDDLPESPFKTTSFLPNSEHIVKAVIGAMDEVKQINENYRIRSSLGFNYKILDGLNLNIVNSADYMIQKYNVFTPGELDFRGFSSIKGGMQEIRTILSENTLNYSKSFNEDHNIEAMLGYVYEATNFTSHGGYADKGPSDYVHYANGKFPWVHKNKYGNIEQLMGYSSNYIESRLISYIGRLKYNYRKKYLFEATFRRDGSSKFGKNNPWGFFPSFSGGYVFSEEGFMSNLPQVSFAKIRGSWGLSGNTFDQAYLAYGVLEPNSTTFDGKAAMGSDSSDGLFNKNLSWEETSQTNLGVDLDLFDYKLSLSFDYYYRYTDKLLFNVPLKGWHSFYNKRKMNAGAISNEGIELSLKLDLLRGSELKWKSTINFARNWNLYRESPDGTDVFGRFIIGKPVNGIYVLETEGLIQDENDLPIKYAPDGSVSKLNAGGVERTYRLGDFKFRDVNGDGTIDYKDKVFKGSPLPKAYGGILNELKWKNFDLNFLFTYSLGKTVLNYSRANSIRVHPADMAAPVLTDISNIDQWEQPGDDAKYAFNTADYRSNYESFTNLWIEKNVNYIKLKTFALGYNLPKEIVKKIKLNNLRVYISGENLWTSTNYKGLDPETVSPNGIDSGKKYPLIRKITCGIDIKF